MDRDHFHDPVVWNMGRARREGSSSSDRAEWMVVKKIRARWRGERKGIRDDRPLHLTTTYTKAARCRGLARYRERCRLCLHCNFPGNSAVAPTSTARPGQARRGQASGGARQDEPRQEKERERERLPIHRRRELHLLPLAVLSDHHAEITPQAVHQPHSWYAFMGARVHHLRASAVLAVHVLRGVRLLFI